MAHWKETATRCAVIGCSERRVKGWSTCRRWNHYPAGKSLYGAGRIAPIDSADLLAQNLPTGATVEPPCRNCGGVDGCFPGCTDRD